ncbi:putative maleylacetoacetate isomerase 2 [Clavelina lepadiformis]
MALKLYSYWRSSCSWRVRVCLALKKQEYEYIPIHLVKDGGEQRKESFRNVNPMAQVPTFVHGDVIISQSMAIMDYIDNKFEGYSLLPKDLALRAKVKEICEIICSGIQPIQNLSVLQKIGEANKMEWAHHWIQSGFDSLEKVLQKSSGKYCVGDDITMADACLVPQVYNANRFKVDMSKYPNISRIEKSLAEQPAFIKAHPDNQPDCPQK